MFNALARNIRGYTILKNILLSYLLALSLLVYLEFTIPSVVELTTHTSVLALVIFTSFLVVQACLEYTTIINSVKWK